MVKVLGLRLEFGAVVVLGGETSDALFQEKSLSSGCPLFLFQNFKCRNRLKAEQMATLTEKTTIVPLYRTSWELPDDTKIALGHGISFENVQSILQPSSFDLWKEYVSADSRKKLAAVKFALVHRFNSSEHVSTEEQKSVDLMFKAFTLLRLIKPTKITWSNIQFKRTSEGPDVFSFTQAPEQIPSLPESDSFNEIRREDIVRLRRLLDPFIDSVETGPINIVRAIKHYELGYSEVHDPMLQFITWMASLEQFYSEGDSAIPRSRLINRISENVNLNDDIYGETQFRQLFPSLPPLRPRDAIHDLFVLRSRFVHGLWVKDEWLRPYRPEGMNPAKTYADALREIASWLVRKSILSYLESQASQTA